MCLYICGQRSWPISDDQPHLPLCLRQNLLLHDAEYINWPVSFRGFFCLCFPSACRTDSIIDLLPTTPALYGLWGSELRSSHPCNRHSPWCTISLAPIIQFFTTRSLPYPVSSYLLMISSSFSRLFLTLSSIYWAPDLAYSVLGMIQVVSNPEGTELWRSRAR